MNRYTETIIMASLSALLIVGMTIAAAMAFVVLIVGLVAWPLLLLGAGAVWLIEAGQFAWHHLFPESDATP